MQKTTSDLSVRARKLYERVQRGEWYPAYNGRTPKAMQELADAGLVTVTGRAKVIEACFVPTTGYTPMQMERFDGEQG